MKILGQIGIVFGICWVSVWIERALPFSFPASVIGMLLLLGLLALRVVKMEHIREKSDFLLANIPFFFIPVTVGIMNYVDVIQRNLLALAAVCGVSLLTTFAATVWSVRLVKRLMEGGRKR